MDTGRVCGTSASSAPSMITMRTSSSLAASTRLSQKRRQRREGSTPRKVTRSPSAPGTGAAQISLAGQSISRARPSVMCTVGRTAVKS